jgi:hypothetical protein
MVGIPYVQDLADASYATVITTIKRERDALEQKWAADQPSSRPRRSTLTRRSRGRSRHADRVHQPAGSHRMEDWRNLFNTLRK